MERRKYIRHPLSYPLETRILQENNNSRRVVNHIVGESDNIGEGGLQFTICREIAVGTIVAVDVSVEEKKFSLNGHVTRCRKCRDGRYVVAVAFDTLNELLKARMTEQVVRIELLKKRMEQRYDVTLDFGCVAREWIKRYSTLFAKQYDV